MKGTSVFRPFLFAVALVILIGYAAGRLLDNELRASGHVAQTSIMDQRNRQAALETEVKARTLPDEVAARRVRIWGGTAFFLILLLGSLVVLGLWAWRSLHTHKSTRGGIWPILERAGNLLVDLNQIEGATYKIGSSQNPADQQRIGREARGIRLMGAATQHQQAVSPDQMGKLLTSELRQEWQERVPPPREIPAGHRSESPRHPRLIKEDRNDR